MKRVAKLIEVYKPVPSIDYHVDIKLEGFSQVQSTVNLFKTAQLDSKVDFISREDVFLYSIQILINKLSWVTDQIYMQMVVSKDHQYCVTFLAPHVEELWQRKFFGKDFTFFLRGLDKVVPTKKKIFFSRKVEPKVIISLLENRGVF